MNKWILISSLLLVLSACSDNDIGADETLAGEINGMTFLYKSARVSEMADGKLLFEIFNEGVPGQNSCGLLPKDIRVFFTSQDTDDRQELFLDVNLFEGFTVTLFDPEGANNIIATDGYFEITNRSPNSIEGILDVQAIGNNYVKGSFTAELCN